MTKLLGVVLVAGTILASALAPARAADLQNPLNQQNCLSNTFTIGGTSFTNPPNAVPAVTLKPGKSFSISGEYVGASSIYSTGVVALGFKLSSDGGVKFTNPSNQWLWTFFQPSGATVTRFYTNITPNTVDNADALALGGLTNAMTATNMVAWLSNVVVTVRN